MKHALLAFALLAGSSATTHAQDQSEFQIWGALLGTGHLSKSTPRLAFWLDVHGRRGETGTVHIFRPAVGVVVTDWLSLWAGYAWVPVFTDGMGRRDEHRIWQQVVLGTSINQFTFQSRTRFEQRFAEGGDDVGFRIRQFVRVNWQPNPNNPVGIALWDELFLGVNEPDWGAPQGFDQNRLFIGPFLKAAPWARLEAGYLFVYLDRDPNIRAHVLAINLFISAKPG